MTFAAICSWIFHVLVHITVASRNRHTFEALFLFFWEGTFRPCILFLFSWTWDLILRC